VQDYNVTREQLEMIFISGNCNGVVELLLRMHEQVPAGGWNLVLGQGEILKHSLLLPSSNPDGLVACLASVPAGMMIVKRV
jgi:hypothetical protein